MASHLYCLLGMDTYELLELGYEASYALDWTINKFSGPILRGINFGMSEKSVFLYPDHLKLLYERFNNNNISGTIMGMNQFYYQYAPKNMSLDEIENLYDKRKMFVYLALTDEEYRYPHLKKYISEIFEQNILEKMLSDPWLDSDLLGNAIREGHVPDPRYQEKIYCHSRWSPEWRIYCNNLK